MNLNRLKNLYTHSPLFIKRMYSFIPFSLRNGKEYRKWKTHLTTRVLMNRNPLETVKYAYGNFNFYRELYNSVDLTNWEKIPLISKDLIQSSLSEFENKQIAKFYVTTGGVTGRPAKFFQTNNVWYKELAFVYDFFADFGYAPNMKKASFRGGDFSACSPDKYWLYNPNYNEIHFSPFHLNETTVYKYIEELNKQQPLYFHGYPSAFIILANLMRKRGLTLAYHPKVFFLISEAYSEKDIVFLENFFNCKMASFYGHSERLVFAKADDTLQHYLPNLDYGYMELVDAHGNVIKENDVVGEIVGTSYDNWAMPLVRYRTGDYTSYSDYTKKIFNTIQGKWGQDHLVGINGEEITLTALNMHSSDMDSVQKIQFKQIAPGRVDVYIVCAEGAPKSVAQNIQNSLTQRVGSLIIFNVTQTDKFILNSRGKAPLIIK